MTNINNAIQVFNRQLCKVTKEKTSSPRTTVFWKCCISLDGHYERVGRQTSGLEFGPRAVGGLLATHGIPAANMHQGSR